MKCMFIYNPKSGKSKVIKKIKYIEDTLSDNGYKVTVYDTKGPKDAIVCANKASELEYDLIVVAGGDGTLNEVITGVVQSGNKNIKIGYLPMGTTNDVAKNLGISRNIKKSLGVIISNNVKKTDVGKINDDYFLYVAAAGVYTRISYSTPRKRKKIFGKGAYVIEAIKETVGPKHFYLSAKSENEEISGEFVMVLILNSKNVGGMSVLKENCIDDGELELIAIRKKSFRNTLRILKFMFLGFKKKKRKKKSVCNMRAKSIEIQCDERVVWNVDGERSSCGNVTITTLKQHINLIIPEKANELYKNQ